MGGRRRCERLPHISLEPLDLQGKGLTAAFGKLDTDGITQLPQISREKIDEVRDRTNISEVIGRHVELKRAGTGSWKGLCPFHAEKSPSFHVNEQRQYFYCFGCGTKGDVFTFLQQVEQQSFVEVLRELASQAGVELPEQRMSPAERKAMADAETERSRMLRVMDLAVGFFESQLTKSEGANARAYLESRGLSAETAARFRVGFAPARYDGLIDFLGEQHVPLAVAERLGLVGRNDRGNYDFFRDRVMLPVLDRQKRPVGFSSRLLDPNAKDRKYVNSPDTPLFHKKEQLYGLHAALEGIRRTETAVLVEGNFDVMSLYDVGITNAVAPMGTALTAEQIATLGRLARKVVVIFDGDAAGERAARRVLPLFLEADVDGRVARMPGGVDPDDFVRRIAKEQGPEKAKEAFQRVIDTSRPMVEQFIDIVSMEADPTVPGRVAALEQAAEVLAQVRNPTARELYAGRLAAALGVDGGQVARAVRAAVNQQRRRGENRQELSPSSSFSSSPSSSFSSASLAAVGALAEAPRPPRKLSPLELEVLALLINRPDLAAGPPAGRVPALFVDVDLRGYASTLLATVKGDLRRGVDVPAWLDAGSAEIRDQVAKAVTAGARYRTLERADFALLEMIAKLELVHLESEVAMVATQLKEALALGDEAKTQSLAIRQIELARQKQSLQ